MTEDEPSQILVVRLGSIGDVLLATPLVRVLRRTYPGTRLGFLVKASCAPLLEGNPHVDRVFVWPSAAGETDCSEDLQAPWSAAVLQLIAELRANRPIWLVDLQASPRSLAFGLLLRPDRGFRYRKDYARRSLLVHARVDRYPRPVPSVAERYFGTVRALGLNPDGDGLDLFLTEAERDGTRRTLAEAGRLAVAPGARWATKRWPPEAFAAAARRIAESHDLAVVLLGSAEDATVTRAVGRMLRQAGIAALDLAGRLSLRESAALISQSSLLLSNDSGLMHVAAALRVPTVAVFGSTVPQLGFTPYRAPARVLGVEGLRCRPCTHMGRPACPLGHFRCMREVDPERAVRSAGELLTGSPTSALASPGRAASESHAPPRPVAREKL